MRGAENTVLLQVRAGLVFPILLFIGLRARITDPGLHKRLMILAMAPALGAGFARIGWLPTTLPAARCPRTSTSCWPYRRCSPGT